MGPFVRRLVARCRLLVDSRLWLVSGALCFSACASDATLGDYPPSTCDFAEPETDVSNQLLLLSTFWTDAKERDALSVLVSHIPERYNYKPLDMENRVDSQVSLNAAFVERRLPDVFQANGGSDVLRWVSDRKTESSAVCELDRLASTFDWPEIYFPESLRPASCHGHLYALPVGIHRLNVLFFNRPLFDKLRDYAGRQGQVLRDPSELTNPEQLLEELSLAAKLGKELELNFAPLAIGGASEWPLTVIAFENVLLGLGNRAYQTLWQGGLQQDPQGERERALGQSLESMVAYLRRLVEVSPVDQELTWQQALRDVGDGEALFTVTGDWGWAQLSEEQAQAVETVPFPGTANYFVYTPDSFAVPRELGKNGERARAFLHDVVANEETLVQFSNTKHSIPPWRDLPASKLQSASLRDTYARFQDCSGGAPNCEPLLAVSGLGPPPGSDDCFDDIDALLTLAVVGKLPSAAQNAPDRECDTQLPPGGDLAKDEAFKLLLRIGKQKFAEVCRP